MKLGRIVRQSRGFTLIELLVVLSIIALLLTLVSPQYFNHIDRAKEMALKQDLKVMRSALDQYFGDHGVYPDRLERLVEDSYLDKIPVDPMTDRADTWVIIRPEEPLKGEVFDVKSASEGVAKDGTSFNSW